MVHFVCLHCGVIDSLMDITTAPKSTEPAKLPVLYWKKNVISPIINAILIVTIIFRTFYKTSIIICCRVPEILQCHSQFRIALTEAVKNWDEVGTSADDDHVITA